MTLKKIESLIALACSTAHEEEARTTALIAVRLIQKEKIKLSEETIGKTNYSNAFDPPQSTYDMWDLWRKVQEQATRARPQYPFSQTDGSSPNPRGKTTGTYEPYGYAYADYNYDQHKPPPKHPAVPPNGSWVKLQRTPDGQPLKCAGCGRAIYGGEKCYVTADRRSVWCSEH